jgi:HTH-type transcriptional regulator, transcriptional repressor of NAD biosynthesis genes
MTRFRHGLVIGKFYPPHLGHHRLISIAAAECDEVSVLVMAASDESIPRRDRARWLDAVHEHEPNVRIGSVVSDAPVDYTDDVIWTAQVALMRTAVSRMSDVAADAVFSSELYGDELARRLGAEHVFVDPAREAVPVSSTMLRNNLAENWHFLAAPTRAGLAIRAVVLGAESTGTTTIAQGLTDHYRSNGGVWQSTQCVAEYGREYSEVKWSRAIDAARSSGTPEPQLDQLRWTTHEFDEIAAEQTRREEDAAAIGSPVLICDTDAFATSIWERRYVPTDYRTNQPWASMLLPQRDVYFLTSHEDVHWTDDGLREGDLAIRADMTQWFAEVLTSAGHSWVLLTGDLDQRLRLATQVIDRLLSTRLSFAPSITESSTNTATSGTT